MKNSPPTINLLLKLSKSFVNIVSYLHLIKVTFAPNLAKKISTNFYYLSLLFQLSVAYSENFKEIKAWEVLKFLKEKIGILPIYFAWRQKLIVFTLCQVCTLYENSIT